MSANDIKQRLDAYKKKRDEAQAPSAPQQNTASANTPSAGSSASSNTQSLSNRLAEYKQKRNELNAPSAFTMFGNRYIKTANGNYNKFVDTRKSEEDKASTLKTGHDTLFTDLQQALFSGVQNWGSGHIQSATTLGLLGGAILTGDENYTPNAGHGLENMLWKMSQVSSANSRANAEMLENAQEGRKWLGRTAMEVVSTMTTNGIDSLIRTLPGGDFLGKLSFASRSFGAASQEAREQGMTIPSQVLKGTISAAIETVTEGMWEYGGTRDFAGEPIKGTGPLGKATEAIENFLTSKLGPIVSPMIMAFGTEAVEEMMADVLNPLAGTIVENTLGKTNLFDDFEGDKWQGIRNMVHDGLIGGLSGIFGGAYEGMMNDAVIKQIYGGNISEWQLARRNEREMQIALTQDKALREMLTKFATKDGRKKLSPFVKKKVRDAFSAEKGRKIGRAIANDFFAAFEELTDEECANPELAMTSLVKRYYDKAASRYGIDINATAEIDDDGDLTPWFIREGETKEEALKRFQEWLDEEDIEEPAEETLEDAEAKEIFEDGITGIQGENERRSGTDLGVESQRPNDTVEVAESQTNELRRESESSFEQTWDNRGAGTNARRVKSAVRQKTGGELEGGEVSTEKSQKRLKYTKDVLSKAGVSEQVVDDLLTDLVLNSRWLVAYNIISDGNILNATMTKEEALEYVKGLVAPELLGMISEGDLASIVTQFRKNKVKEADIRKQLEKVRAIMSDEEKLYDRKSQNKSQKSYNTNALADTIIMKNSGKNNKVARVTEFSSRVGDADTVAYGRKRYVAQSGDVTLQDSSGIDSPYSVIKRVVGKDVKYLLVDDDGYQMASTYSDEEKAFAAAHRSSATYLEGVVSWKYIKDGDGIVTPDNKTGENVINIDEIYGLQSLDEGRSGKKADMRMVARNRNWLSDALGVKYSDYIDTLATTKMLTVDLSGATADEAELVVQKLMDASNGNGGIKASNGKTYVFVTQPANARKDGIIRLMEKDAYRELRRKIAGFLTEDELTGLVPAKFMANEGVVFTPSNVVTGTKIKDIVILKDHREMLNDLLVNYMVTDLVNDEAELTSRFTEMYIHRGMTKTAAELKAKEQAKEIIKNGKVGQGMMMLLDYMVNSTDGFGLFWNDLGVGNSAQVRAAGIKGFALQMDFYKYLDTILKPQEKAPTSDKVSFYKDMDGNIYAKDVWGEWVNLAGKKGLFFESMIKFSGKYTSKIDGDSAESRAARDAENKKLREKFYDKDHYGEEDLRALPKESVYGSNKGKGMVEGKTLRGLAQVFRKELGFTQEEVDRILVSDRLQDVQDAIMSDPKLMVKMFGASLKKSKFSRVSNIEAMFINAFGEKIFNYDMGKKWAAKKLSKIGQDLMGAKMLFDENQSAYEWLAPDVLTLLRKMADIEDAGYSGLTGKQIFVDGIAAGDTLIARSPSAEQADAQIRQNVINEYYKRAIEDFGLDPNVAYLALDDNLGLHLDNDFDGDASLFAQGVGVKLIQDKREETKRMIPIRNPRTGETTYYNSYDIPTVFAHLDLSKEDKVAIDNYAKIGVIRLGIEAEKVGVFDMGIDMINGLSDEELAPATERYNEKHGTEYTPSAFRSELAARFATAYKFAFDYAKTGWFPKDFKAIINMTMEMLDDVLLENGYTINWADKYGNLVERAEAAYDEYGRPRKMYDAAQPALLEYGLVSNNNKQRMARNAQRGQEATGQKYVIEQGSSLFTMLAKSNKAKKLSNEEEIQRRITRANKARGETSKDATKLEVLSTIDGKVALDTLMSVKGLKEMLRFAMQAINYQYADKSVDDDVARENAKKLLYKLQKSLGLDGEQIMILMFVANDADLNTANIDTLLKFDQRSVDNNYKGITTAEALERNLAVYAAVNGYNNLREEAAKLEKQIHSINEALMNDLAPIKERNRVYSDSEAMQKAREGLALWEEHQRIINDADIKIAAINKRMSEDFTNADIQEFTELMTKLSNELETLQKRRDASQIEADAIEEAFGEALVSVKDVVDKLPSLTADLEEMQSEIRKNQRVYDYAMEVANAAGYDVARSGDYSADLAAMKKAISESRFGQELAANIEKLNAIKNKEYDDTVLQDIKLAPMELIQRGEAPKIISKQESDSYYAKDSKKNTKELFRRSMENGDAEIVYWNKALKDPNREFVVFDTETTGTKDNDKLLQISAVVYRGGEIVDQFDTLVNSVDKVPRDITELTGITTDMIKAENTKSEYAAVKEFLEFVKGRPVIAHNAGFDAHFISQAATEYNLNFDSDVIDTLSMARALFRDGISNKLPSLADKLDIEYDASKLHNAVSDVDVLAEIVKGLSDRFDGYLARRASESVIPTHAEFLPEDMKTRVMQGREVREFFDNLYKEKTVAQKQKVNGKTGTASDVEDFRDARRKLRGMHGRISNLANKMNSFVSSYANDKDNLLGRRRGRNSIRSDVIAKKVKTFTDNIVGFNNGSVDIATVSSSYDDLEGTRYYNEDVARMFKSAIKNQEAQEERIKEQSAIGNKDTNYSQQFGRLAYMAISAAYSNMQTQERAISSLLEFNKAVEAKAINFDKRGSLGRIAARMLRRQVNSPTMFKLMTGFDRESIGYKFAEDITDAISLNMSLISKSTNFFADVAKDDGYDSFVNGETKVSEVLKDSKYDSIKDMSLIDLVYALQSVDTINYSEKIYSKNVEGVVVDDKVYDDTIIRDKDAIYAEIKKNKLVSDYIDAVDSLMETYDKLAQEKSLKVYGFAPFTMGRGHHVPVQFVQVTDGKVVRNDNLDNWDYERHVIQDPEYTIRGASQDANYLDIVPMTKAIDAYVSRISDFIAFKEVRDNLLALNYDDGSDLRLSKIAGNNWGSDFGTWVENFVRDATMTDSKKQSFLSNARIAVEKGILIGSPSVMMKQFASFFNAMGLLSGHSLLRAAKVMIPLRNVGQNMDAIKYRLQTSSFDPTLTEILKTDTGIVDRVLNKIPGYKALTKGIAKVDNFTVNALYIATLYEIQDQLAEDSKNGITHSTDEIKNMIEDKLNEVLIYSQPMFQKMLRAEYQRTDEEAIRLLSMFRTQQTQTMNRLLTTIGEFRADKRAGRDTTDSEKALRGTVNGLVMSSLALSLFSVLADALLHKTKKYRDEEEEVDVGKIAERLFFINPLENAAGTVWFGDEATKYIIDLITGDTSESYGISLGIISTVNNAMEAVKTFTEQGTLSSARYAAGYISQLFGIPLNNIYAYLNTVGTYAMDITGNNEHHLDDMLRAAERNKKTNKELSPSQRALVELGWEESDATKFIKGADIDVNGKLSQKELEKLYLSDPEAAGAIQALWDMQGWSGDWESKKEKLDRHILYTQNPLYAELDSNHDEQLSQKEVVNYLLDNENADYDELSKIWDAHEWATDFDDAIKQTKNKRIKEEVDVAYEAGNYNVLFDTLKEYSNGKAYLADKISDETGDNLTSNTNLVLGYILHSNLSVPDFDDAVNEYADKKTLKLYTTMRNARIQNREALRVAMAMDVNESGTISQSDFVEFYKKNKDKEKIVEMLWNSMGYSGKYTKTWAAYKKRNKIS